MNFSKIIVFVFAFIFLHGCTNADLDREVAKKLIIKAEGYPYVETKLIPFSTLFISGFDNFGYANMMKFSEEMRRLKLADWSCRKIDVKSVFYNWGCEMVMSENLYSDPAFVNNEYKVETIRGRDGSFSYIRLPHFKRDFGGISGIYYIDENKSEAIVEFTELNEKLKYYGVKAPEIQGIPLKARDRGLEVEAVAKKKVAMRRYDDGWRVVATSPRFE